MKRLLVLSILFLLSCTTTTPQRTLTELPRVQALLERPDIQAAFNHVESNRDPILREWIALTEINAPSGHEAQRAAYVEARLREMASLEVSRDAAGNVIARRRGTGGGQTVVIDAHLDTVFQPGQQITVRTEGDVIYAPGVGDNTRNIEAILAIARALDAGGVRTAGDLIFLFTVEEETDFRGVNQFLADHKGRVDHFIALDGGYSGFTYGGLGINWYRFHFIGPGGHTRSGTPPYSAALPMARAIDRIYRLRVPDDSHLNIGMLGGAEVVNAKAADAWFSVDLRSERLEVMTDLERRITEISEQEARRAGMTFRREDLSLSPPATLEGHREGPLVRTAEAVYEALGFTDPSITATATNHVNPALAAGVSAISTGTTPCRESHALTENCDIEPFYRGIKKILLLAVAMSS